jgi:hypothetical protein
MLFSLFALAPMIIANTLRKNCRVETGAWSQAPEVQLNSPATVAIVPADYHGDMGDLGPP